MEDSGVEGIRISEGSGSGLGRYGEEGSIKRNWAKGECVAKRRGGGMGEIKEKIRLRRQVYKEISSGREDKWGENYKLHSEIKDLVRKKKLYSWIEVIERLIKIFMKTGKNFGHLLAGL